MEEELRVEGLGVNSSITGMCKIYRESYVALPSFSIAQVDQPQESALHFSSQAQANQPVGYQLRDTESNLRWGWCGSGTEIKPAGISFAAIDFFLQSTGKLVC